MCVQPFDWEKVDVFTISKRLGAILDASTNNQKVSARAGLQRKHYARLGESCDHNCCGACRIGFLNSTKFSETESVFKSQMVGTISLFILCCRGYYTQVPATSQ